ncbi:MAG: hypothetical protein ABSB74_05385 [Tepidisphaeraceae bacterium]
MLSAALVDPTATGFSTSLSLTPGAQTYIYGEVTGGGASSSPLANGSADTVTDGAGNLGVGLAVTTQASNSFTTQTGYYSIAGVGVSGYTNMQALYGQYVNPNSGVINSGSFGTSVIFTLTQPALVVAMGGGSSQQAISFSGVAGLVTDAVVSGAGNGLANTIGIAHDSLGPGTYTIQLSTTVTSNGQEEQHVADLLGVYIFTGSTSATVPTATITTPTGTQSGNVTINYTLTDANSDPCSILAQYSADGGTTWNTATAGGGDGTTGLSSTPGGITHSFVWASATDLPGISNSDVEFRITPSSAGGSGSTAATGIFAVNNTASAMLPIAAITSPIGGTHYGNIQISYTLTDANSDACNILAQYRFSTDGGSTWSSWSTATSAPNEGDGTTGLTSSATGIAHTFVWAAISDLVAYSNSVAVEFEITPSSQEGQGTFGTTNFTVNNISYGLTPAMIRQYYGFDQLSYDGSGQTIAIVDPGYDPTIWNDLQQFDQTFDLSSMGETSGAPTSASIANKNSQPTFYWDSATTTPSGNSQYYDETALDVEWAHAIAPMANIVLVEPSSILLPSMMAAAISAAGLPGVSVVSLSWGGPAAELSASIVDPLIASAELLYNVTFVASAGDTPLVPNYPATSPYVLSVGGTSLSYSSGNWSESPDNYGLLPGVAYADQLGSQLPKFAIASQGSSTYAGGDGTSAGAPQWAAVIALADQGRQAGGLKNLTGFTQTLPAIGAAPAADFNPGTGSLDTGRGSPMANELVPYLASWRAPQLIFTQLPSNITAGQPFAVAVTLENQNGGILSNDNSNVTIGLGTDPTLYGTTTVAAVNGVATFSNLYVDKSGSYTFVATDAADGLAASTPSTPITVTPAAATTLAFIQQPSNTTAGNIISPAVTVAVEDQFGNVVTTDNSYVTLRVVGGSSTDGDTGGFLSSFFSRGFGPIRDSDWNGRCADGFHHTLTVKVQDGLATFANLSLDKAGEYALKATDHCLSSATSTSFAVTPAAAVRMVFLDIPSCDSNGKTFKVQVALFDRYGNLATNDKSSVTLSLGAHPKNDVLTGTLTAVVVNGIATFDDLSLSGGGWYSLVVMDSDGIPSISSSLIYFGRDVCGFV